MTKIENLNDRVQDEKGCIKNIVFLPNFLFSVQYSMSESSDDKNISQY
jgi:hypothetical protein